jgi:mono/diheme cytochrome c family protein
VAWAALGDGACPRSGAPAGVVAAARRALQRPREPAVELAFCMQRDGCLSCHRRDGQGGLRAEAKSALVEVEDLGDEGRLPPDLTRVGHRLRPVWLLGVLRGEHRVRPYLHVRMPHLSEAAAQRYADLFAAVDAEPGEDQEPPFSVAAVAEGRRLAGTGGFNCIACHPFGSHRAIGPQGMDLAVQFDRLRPAWFCDLLLHTTKLRPGTRMPGYWFADGEKDRAQVEALRTWLSLRRAAPVPAGFAENSAALVLDPADRPRLHGAFLEGLSARCMAVGTPEHTHYAYDLSRGRLAWLWRGAFVDADGTWSGRAGKLLQPLGDDWVVLDKDCTFAPAGGGGTQAVLAGWELAPDGLPVFHWRLDDALIDDAARPRLQAGGTVLVRELTAHGGAVRLGLPHDGRVHAFVGDEERSEVVVPAGGRAEVVYRW